MEKTTAIKEQIKQFIVESTNVAADEVKDDTMIFIQGYFDSMGFLLLISFLEEKFGIKVDDSELLEENFESVNAITAFVERKTAAA
ncbi:MAG: acyl carrier protein [Ferruginibacter sp.]